MLDDLKMIHERDAQDALGVAEKQWQQYLYNYDFHWTPQQPIHEVIVAGMGGSGLAAKAYQQTGGLQLPFSVLQDYDLPERVGQNTLLVCSSYSGNTEEEISILTQALDPERPKRPQIVVIASGGRLLELAKANNLPYFELPAGYQPRHTFGYQFRALAELFDASQLSNNFVASLETAANWLQDEIPSWLPTVPTTQNQAKQLAQEVIGKSAVIYAAAVFGPTAYKWKISFNENAKHIAWTNVLPEFNHNEMLGWTKQPTDKPYAVIDLRSQLVNPRISKRFEVTERLLSGQRPEPEVVNLVGPTILHQQLWGVALGDFVSLYTALLNGINPTPVDLIESFKQKLDE